MSRKYFVTYQERSIGFKSSTCNTVVSMPDTFRVADDKSLSELEKKTAEVVHTGKYERVVILSWQLMEQPYEAPNGDTQ